MCVVSTHNIEIIVVECANRISINVAFPYLHIISTYGGALADPEYVRMVAPQFAPRKEVANLCVHLRASEQTIALRLDFILAVWLLFLGISVSGKGGIRLRRRKPYYLNQMDHSVRPS